MAEVITGEAVVIDLPTARFPSRAVAVGIDLAIQVILLVGLGGIAVAAGVGGGLDPAAVTALGLTVTVAVIIGYPVTWETLTRGRTVGKLIMGLRVVSDDGGPERLRQALMRALIGVLEIWLTAGFLALITSLLSASGKRLGDITAGTFVIAARMPQQRGMTAPLSALPPALAAWAATLELSGLDDATAELARQYLSRYHELTPAARDDFGERLAGAVASQVSPAPPPGTTPPDYLSAVLAQRRAREQARITGHANVEGSQAPAGLFPPTAGEAAATAPQGPPRAAAEGPGGFLPPR